MFLSRLLAQLLRRATGAAVIIQSGGSKNYQALLTRDATDRLGLSMVFIGMRHFRH